MDGNTFSFAFSTGPCSIKFNPDTDVLIFSYASRISDSDDFEWSSISLFIFFERRINALSAFLRAVSAGFGSDDWELPDEEPEFELTSDSEPELEFVSDSVSPFVP